MTETFVFENIRDLDLKQTFECGQCFRWNEERDGSYTGIAQGYPANMKLEGDRLIIEGYGTREFWAEYLDLDRDYCEIQAILAAKEPEVMPEAMACGSGIRILCQDLWETVVDFIISQNNNIPRIKGCIERLAEAHGEYAGEFRDKSWYRVPTAEKLASLEPEDLAEVRLGYRDKYLIETARQWLAKDEDSRCDVGCFTGVGPKVESCIRLFGLHELDAFPIDVWVKRLMNRFYGFEEKDKAGMDAFANDVFGEYAGLAQQYLFYYIRCLEK
ncbi:MAG: 8-oxoguanine DNA glycosylase [Firmicutes bacterium]|nr:8-oxoguanine DNA glycosylase [Bacillota bacterium]